MYRNWLEISDSRHFELLVRLSNFTKIHNNIVSMAFIVPVFKWMYLDRRACTIQSLVTKSYHGSVSLKCCHFFYSFFFQMFKIVMIEFCLNSAPNTIHTWTEPEINVKKRLNDCFKMEGIKAYNKLSTNDPYQYNNHFVENQWARSIWWALRKCHWAIVCFVLKFPTR